MRWLGAFGGYVQQDSRKIVGCGAFGGRAKPSDRKIVESLRGCAKQDCTETVLENSRDVWYGRKKLSTESVGSWWRNRKYLKRSRARLLHAYSIVQG